MAKVSHWNVAVGQAVRDLRKEQGISQDVLASESGLHRTYIGKVERVECDLGVTNLYRLAVALGLQGSELLARAEQLEG